MMMVKQPSRPWEWRSGETAATFDQWLTQAAETRHFEHAEEAIRKLWLLTWLVDRGDVFAAEQVRPAKSRSQLLDRTKGEGVAPLDLPPDTHLENLLTIGNELYTSNVFRLTGLPVIATARDIARHLDRLKLQEKLGTKGSRPSGPLPIDPPPNIDTIRAAVQALTKDPELRILQEFFWFWPLPVSSTDKSPETDQALQDLTQGDFEKAIRQWEHMEPHSAEGPIARHNLAILYHAAALDLELKGTLQTLSEEQKKQRNTFWNRALDFWRIISDEEAVWSWLATRIRSLEDARLTTGYARRLRTYLPVILSSVNGSLAAQSAEAGLGQETDRHIARLVSYAHDSQTLNHMVMRIVETYRDRLRACCKQAEEMRTSQPLQGIHAAETLLNQAGPLLRVVDAVTYSGSSGREAAHDYVALNIFDCITIYENKTHRYRATIPVFEQALTCALGESTKKKIADELAASKKLLESGDIWFDEGYFDQPQPILDKLEQARALANSTQYDQAISILVDLLYGHREPTILRDQEHVVQKPLAWCLSRRSVKRVNDAMDQQNIELEIIKNIRQRAANPTKGFNYSFAAARQGSNQGLPYLECMACGATIQQSYYHFSYKFNEEDVKVLICPSCNTKSDEERDRRRVAFKKVVHESAQDIQLAVELDDTNQQVKKNIADLKGIASSNDITWPSSQELRLKLGLISDTDLLRSFQSEDPSVRRQAMELTGKRVAMGSRANPALLSAILDMVIDPIRSVRDAAWSALNNLGEGWSQTDTARRKLDILLEAASKGKREIADSAARAVKKIDPLKAERLRSLQRSRRFKKLAIAASVVIVSVGIFVGSTFQKSSEGDLLASIQLHTWHLLDEATTFAKIEEAARSSDSTTRLHAIEAWKQLADKRTVVVPALILAQLDENPKVVSAASRAMEEISTAYGQDQLPEVKLAIPGLIKAAATGPASARGRAITLLMMIGPDEHDLIIPTLTSALRGIDKEVRVLAAEALRNIGPRAKQAIPALQEALNSDDWDLRIAAAEGLAAMGEDGLAAKPTIKSMLTQLPPKSPHRTALSNVLARMESEVKSVAKVAKTPDAKLPKPQIKATKDEEVDKPTIEGKGSTETSVGRAHDQGSADTTVTLAETRPTDEFLSAQMDKSTDEFITQMSKTVPSEQPERSSHALDDQWLAQLLKRRVAETMIYPYQARFQGMEGTVVLTAVIRSDGQLSKVEVLQSSSHPLLDEAALETVKRATPLTMAQPIRRPELTVEIPVVYRLSGN